MPGARDVDRRGTATLAISVLLHAALIFLMPGLGASPSSALVGKGGAVTITLVEASSIVQANSKQVTTAVNVKPTQPKTMTKPVKPAVTPKAATTKPVAKASAPSAKTSTAAPKATSQNRVLTSDKGIETTSAASAAKQERVEDAKPTTSLPEAAEPEGPVEPPPPTAGSAVSGFGKLPRLSGKETEELTDIARIKVIATVPSRGAITARLASPSNNPALGSLEKLAAHWVRSEQYMKFQRLAKDYEVAIIVVVDPQANKVAFEVASPTEQVRIVS